ncbi:MAG: sulfatase [Myxococcales bacterium]|nr:sulfatase [Myxococcales bacterium]
MDRRVAAGAVAAVVFGSAALYLAWPWLAGDDAPLQGRGAKEASEETLRHTPAAPVDRARAPEGAPNVVLVIGCTVRRDQMTPYGGPAQTTPFLTELANDGVRFEGALSTSSWTREASVGLLVGRHAASVGMAEPGPRHSERVLPSELTTLAERFQAAGWSTVGVTANPNLNYEFGFGQGFDAYRDTLSERAFATENKIGGTRVVRDALKLVDARTPEDAERPLFLQVVIIDPHTPRYPRPKELMAVGDPGTRVSRTVLEYRALLRRTDAAVARLQGELKERGITPQDTLWVFVADHGEGLSMPAHHGGGHGKRMYGSTVRIPWLVRGPGVPAGHRIDGLASGVDLVPTLIGLTGLPADPALPGRDFSALVQGEGGRTDRERAFAASMFLRSNIASVWTDETQCQSGYDPEVRPRDRIPRGCFDRESDPSFRLPSEDAALLAELDAWRQQRLAEGEGADPEQLEPADDLDAQLEALGYRE